MKHLNSVLLEGVFVFVASDKKSGVLYSGAGEDFVSMPVYCEGMQMRMAKEETAARVVGKLVTMNEEGKTFVAMIVQHLEYKP